MSQIQLQINCCRLDIIMAESVFDIGDGLSETEHSYGTGVPEAMSRVDMLKSFRIQCLKEVLFAKVIDAVSGKFFMALIDKQAVPIWPFGGGAVFLDIERDEVYGFGFEFYQPEAVALAQDMPRAFVHFNRFTASE